MVQGLTTSNVVVAIVALGSNVMTASGTNIVCSEDVFVGGMVMKRVMGRGAKQHQTEGV